MSKKRKVTLRRAAQTILMIQALCLALSIPFTGHTADLAESLIKAALVGDTVTVEPLLVGGSR